MHARMITLALIAVTLSIGTAFSGPASDVPVWTLNMRLTDGSGGPRNPIVLSATDRRATPLEAYAGPR